MLLLCIGQLFMFLPTGLTVGKTCLQLPEAVQLGLSHGFGDVSENNGGSLPEYKEPLIVMRI